MKLTLASKEFLKEIEVRKYTPKTIRSYRNNLNLFLCYCAENGVEDTEDITLGTVKGFAFFMSSRGRKGTYINSLLKSVKSFIQYCYDEEYGCFNTRGKFVWCKEEKPIIRTFQPKDVKRMLSHCSGRDFLSIRDRAVLTTFFETGICCWELCCIKNADIYEDFIIIHGKNHMFAIKKDIAGKIGYTILAITQQGVKPKNMSDKGQFALDYSKYQIVNPGDFAMNHMDLLTGWVDISKFAGVTSPDYRVFYPLTPDEIDADYYKHLFQTCYRCRIFYGLGQGVSGFGRWRLPAEMFLNFVLPVPPLDEQKEIAAFLEKQCSQIDGIIAEKEALVSDLESYKKSLIYEVVTGKRRVPAPSEATVVAVHPSVLGYQKALLMCRVLDLLGDDTRGRIHVQKCLFAVECLLEMPFQTQYIRYEHGPYDTHITDCEALIVENDWFTIQNGSPVIYKKGAHFNAYLDEYMKVFADMDSKIKEIVEFLKPMKTSQAERIATLLAAWNDFILDGTAEPTDQQIVNEVMTNWTPNKANTQLLTWQNSMDKLKQSGFVPAGLGVHTIKKEAQEV